MTRNVFVSNATKSSPQIRPGGFRVILLTFSLVVGMLIASPQMASGEGGTCYTVVSGVVDNGRLCTGSLVIGEGVTSIGARAFVGSRLTSITLPSTITSIGAEAFKDAIALTSMSIPSSVTSIGAGAFQGAISLTSISIPSSVTSIGAEAFKDAIALTSMIIPSSVTSIGAYALFGTTSLNSILVDSSNLNFTSEDDVLFNKVKSILIAYPANKPGPSYSIPASVIDIGDGAFALNKFLSSVIIPSSVKSIGEGAFGRSSIESMSIPDSVSSLGESSFGGTEKLKSIDLGNGLVSIGEVAFTSSGIMSITIPKSVTLIADNAFEECLSLKAVIFENGLTPVVLGNSLFTGTAVSDVTLSSRVTRISDGMFESINRLTNINIPNSVTSIGALAFGYSGLANVNFLGNAPETAHDAFRGVEGATAYILPGATGFTTPTWQGLNVSVLVPRVVIPTYAISYSGNSGDVTSLPYDFNGYVSNQKVALTSQIPQRTGYTFTGWNSSADASGTAYSAGSSLVINNFNTILYAQWTINSYTLSFSGNGGPALTFAPQTREYQSVSKLPVIEGDVLRTGYTFLGWNSTADGSGTSYAPTDLFKYPAGNTTLHAQWKINSYTISYDGNGVRIGKVPGNSSYLYNSEVQVKASSRTFTRPGYVFQGWNTAKDGTGKSFVVDQRFAMGAGNQILYANWIPNTYQVRFVTSAKNPLSNAQFVTGGSIASGPAPAARVGYTFKGWSTSRAGTQVIIFPYSPSVIRNHSLYAVWEKNK